MIWIFWLLMHLLTSTYSQSCSDYYKCQLNLYDQLLNRSRPSLRPINDASKNTSVRLGFSLIRLVSVNEADSLLTIRAHLNQTWDAPIFAWNASMHFNVQHFRVPAHLVWTPKLELVNPSTAIDSEANHFVDVQSTGTFELSYSTLLTIPCNFDLKDFPFDQQRCTFKIGSSLYDINEVSIVQAIDFVIIEPYLMPNGYAFVSHTIDQKPVYFAGFDSNYDQVLIEFTIQRRSSYFLRLISWPGSILVLLTLVIFFLPPTASERILYGGFLLLCQFILLAIFAFSIPKQLGTQWPWMARTIFYDICLTSMVLIFSGIVRMLAEGKHYTTERPPMKIRNFTFGYLSKLIGHQQLSYATLMSTRENDYDTNDPTTNESMMEPLTSVSNGSTTSDSLNSSSHIISRDIGTIKKNLHVFTHEHSVHKEWILLAHIVNRLCFVIYLFFLSFSIGHHLFS